MRPAIESTKEPNGVLIVGGTKKINSQDEVKISIKEHTGSSSTISKVPETVMDDLIKGIQLSRRLQQIKPMK